MGVGIDVIGSIVVNVAEDEKERGKDADPTKAKEDVKQQHTFEHLLQEKGVLGKVGIARVSRRR